MLWQQHLKGDQQKLKKHFLSWDQVTWNNRNHVFLGIRNKLILNYSCIFTMISKQLLWYLLKLILISHWKKNFHLIALLFSFCYRVILRWPDGQVNKPCGLSPNFLQMCKCPILSYSVFLPYYAILKKVDQYCAETRHMELYTKQKKNT